MRAVKAFLAGWGDRGREMGEERECEAESDDCHDWWKTENIQTD